MAREGSNVEKTKEGKGKRERERERERGEEIESRISWTVDKIVCPYYGSRTDPSIVP